MQTFADVIHGLIKLKYQIQGDDTLTKSIELFCLPFIKENEKIDALKHLTAICQHNPVALNEALFLATMNGINISEEELATTLVTERRKKCEKYADEGGISEICKLCEFSCSYTQKFVDTEQKILHTCMKNTEEKKRLLQFLEQVPNRQELLFQSNIQIPATPNVLQFNLALFKQLCNLDEIKDIRELTDTLCKIFVDETKEVEKNQIRSFVLRNIESIYNLPDEEIDVIELASSILPECDIISDEPNTPLSVSETNQDAETEARNEKPLHYLTNDGFLQDAIELKEDIMFINDKSTQLMFRYDAMSSKEIAMEPVTISSDRVSGLLIYLIPKKHYYFLPDNMHNEIIRDCLKGLFGDTQRIILTMIDIPLYYKLYNLGYEEKNISSLYDIYSVANGASCLEPYNIVRTVAGEFSYNATDYIYTTLPYYMSVYKKYSKVISKEGADKLNRLKYKNHIYAMSYKLPNLLGNKECYLKICDGNIEMKYDENILSSTGKIIEISYANPVDVFSRYRSAFLEVIKKTYTKKLYREAPFRILHVDDKLVLWLGNSYNEDIFLSCLNYLLIASGRKYVAKIPKVVMHNK